MIPTSFFFDPALDLPWRNAPVQLTAGQAAHPHSVLDVFFTSYPYPQLKSTLLKWLLAALDSRRRWKRKKLADLLSDFHALGLLMEALWLLRAQAGTEVGGTTAADPPTRWSPTVLDQMRWYGYQEGDYRAEHLSEREAAFPEQVIVRFFTHRDLWTAKDGLTQWSYRVFAHPLLYTAIEKRELLALYRDVERLLEAAFLVNERHLLTQFSG